MSEKSLQIFESIVSTLSSKHALVQPGPMMSSPGLKYNYKVFAFYLRGTMGFRLGPQFDPIQHGIKSAKPLSPFKTKPPLKGWHMIDHLEAELWPQLAEMALKFTMTLK